MNLSIEEVIMVLAGAYCTKENSHKVFDPTLVQTMAIDIMNLISAKKKAIGCESCYYVCDGPIKDCSEDFENYIKFEEK